MGGRYYLTGVQIGMLRAFLQIAEDEMQDNSCGIDRAGELLKEIEDNQHMCSASSNRWRTFVREMFIKDKAVKP